MGIYIPGMELPENCICCDLSHEDGWCPAKQTYTDRYTFKTCPLIPVPKHGRLIDADAVERNLVKMQQAQTGPCSHGVRKSRAVLRDMPTIIPAEPEEEET